MTYETTTRMDNKVDGPIRRSFSTYTREPQDSTLKSGMARKNASREENHMKTETQARNDLGESGPDGTAEFYLKNKNQVSNTIWDKHNVQWDPDAKLQKQSSTFDATADPTANLNTHSK
uniref:Protein translocase subunit SecA n=1 Tax=Lygus hesperus TaxID=30085 RepID=A0A0A9YMC8_LYGHE